MPIRPSDAGQHPLRPGRKPGGLGPGPIDTHLHTWDPTAIEYPWLTAKWGDLARPRMLGEVLPLQRRAGIAGSLLVQAANSEVETALLLACARRHPEVLGVVGWLPLIEPERVASLLEKMDPLLVGVRHLTHLEEDPYWLLRPEVLESLSLVAEAGLPLDVVGVRRQELDAALELGRRLPDLGMVLDHCGQPPRPGERWDPWWDLVAALGRNPRVTAKLSGLGTTTARPTSWSEGDVEVTVSFVLASFGPDRVVCGSDWPVCNLARGYLHTWSVTRRLLRDLPRAHQEAVLRGNAQRVYLLGDRAARGGAA